MAWSRGFAREPENPNAPATDPWTIVDSDDQFLVFFDQAKFSRILDGAPVVYTVGNDGFAENVQPLNSVNRYVGRFLVRNELAAPAPPAVEERLNLLVMAALLEAKDLDGEARGRHLRRLRTAIDHLEL